MKVITAPEIYDLKPNEISLFLAGGITNCPDWQSEIIERLEEYKIDNLVIFNPRRDNFPINNKDEALNQITWEFNQLEKIDIFSMYFCSGPSDQPICMYELGRNIVRIQQRFPENWEDRIIVTVEEDYKRAQDVIIQYNLAFGRKWKYFSYPYHTDYIYDSYDIYGDMKYCHVQNILTVYNNLSLYK